MLQIGSVVRLDCASLSGVCPLFHVCQQRLCPDGAAWIELGAAVRLQGASVCPITTCVMRACVRALGLHSETVLRTDMIGGVCAVCVVACGAPARVSDVRQNGTVLGGASNCGNNPAEDSPL